MQSSSLLRQISQNKQLRRLSPIASAILTSKLTPVLVNDRICCYLPLRFINKLDLLKEQLSSDFGTTQSIIASTDPADLEPVKNLCAILTGTNANQFSTDQLVQIIRIASFLCINDWSILQQMFSQTKQNVFFGFDTDYPDIPNGRTTYNQIPLEIANLERLVINNQIFYINLTLLINNFDQITPSCTTTILGLDETNIDGFINLLRILQKNVRADHYTPEQLIKVLIVAHKLGLRDKTILQDAITKIKSNITLDLVAKSPKDICMPLDVSIFLQELYMDKAHSVDHLDNSSVEFDYHTGITIGNGPFTVIGPKKANGYNARFCKANGCTILEFDSCKNYILCDGTEREKRYCLMDDHQHCIQFLNTHLDNADSYMTEYKYIKGKLTCYKKHNFNDLSIQQQFLILYIINQREKAWLPVRLDPKFLALLPKKTVKLLQHNEYLSNGILNDTIQLSVNQYAKHSDLINGLARCTTGLMASCYIATRHPYLIMNILETAKSNKNYLMNLIPACLVVTKSKA